MSRRKPSFIIRFIVHLYIQLDIKNLAVEYSINFLSSIEKTYENEVFDPKCLTHRRCC